MKPKFEEVLKKLSAIVEGLATGGVSLDKAIKEYQEGMLLSKQCLDLLEEAERKVKVCVKDKSGNIKLKPFKEKKDAG